GDEIGRITPGLVQKLPVEQCLPMNLCDDHSGRLDGKISQFSDDERSLINYWRFLLGIRQKYHLWKEQQTVLGSDEILAIRRGPNVVFAMNVSEIRQVRFYPVQAWFSP